MRAKGTPEASFPDLARLRALEADPERVHRGCDHALAGNLGVLGPPDGKALEDAAEDDPDHFDPLVLDRAGDVLGAGLGGEERQDRLAAARSDLGVDCLENS